MPHSKHPENWCNLLKFIVVSDEWSICSPSIFNNQPSSPPLPFSSFYIIAEGKAESHPLDVKKRYGKEEKYHNR